LPNSGDPVEFIGDSKTLLNGYAFRLQEGATASAFGGFFGYLNLVAPSSPEENAGLRFSGFESGALYVWQQSTKPWSSDWRFSIDGCAAEESSRMLNILADADVNKDGLVILSRSFITLPSTLAPSHVTNDLPMVEVRVSGSAEVGIKMQGVDIRPADLTGETGLVAVDVKDVGSKCSVRMEQCVLEGRDRGATVPGVGFKGAGVELVGSARAFIHFSGVGLIVRDAFGDGIVAVVRNGVSTGDRTKGVFELEDSSVELNGHDSPNQPYLSSNVPEFSRSGVHLVVEELARWTSTVIDSSVIGENYRHGVLYSSSGRYEYSPGFTNCEINESQLLENGTTLDPYVRGDGVHCALTHDSMLLGVSRSLIRGNQSAGLFVHVDSNDEEEPDYFRVLAVNSVITDNQGVRTTQQPGDEYSSPICVTYSKSENASGWLRLSGLTVTNNVAPYALAVFAEDDTSFTRSELVGLGSTVLENCVFRGNVPVTGSEQSYFPLPLTPIWDALWAKTFNCCLIGDPMYYVPGVRLNFLADPDLRAYSIAGVDFGTTFPCTILGGCSSQSPLVNAGRSPGVPQAGGEDVRGFDRPGSSAGDLTYDVGAFEIQNGE
jgi:hypothetical protein